MLRMLARIFGSAAVLPVATTAAEALWNSRPYNADMAKYMSAPSTAAIRTADLKSKEVYDSMDEMIQQLRDFQVKLAKLRTSKDSAPE